MATESKQKDSTIKKTIVYLPSTINKSCRPNPCNFQTLGPKQLVIFIKLLSIYRQTGPFAICHGKEEYFQHSLKFTCIFFFQNDLSLKYTFSYISQKIFMFHSLLTKITIILGEN